MLIRRFAFLDFKTSGWKNIVGVKFQKVDTMYVMKEEIGRGAFSTCHRAIHKMTGVNYAVKVGNGFVNGVVLIDGINCLVGHRWKQKRCDRGSGDSLPVRCLSSHCHVEGG